MSKVDKVVRSVLLTQFFTKGWGTPENLKTLFNFRKIMSNREKCRHLVSKDYPIYIDKEEVHSDHKLLEGHFISPFVQHLPGVMPKAVEMARFQMILPKTWRGNLRPVCIQLGGTGDHGFARRKKLVARPLLKEAGIASIILENPYYGCRKPKEQVRSSLLYVSDLFVMGGGLILESLALLNWCERQGFGPLGLTGISMGGHMASLAATNWHHPISLVPCMSWSTASAVFTEGVMSQAIPWSTLQKQYCSDSIYEEQVQPLICSPEENTKNSAFILGQDFARNYPTYRNSKADKGAKICDNSKTNQVKLKEQSHAHYLNYFTTAGASVGTLLQQQFAKSLDLLRIKNNKALNTEALHFMRGVMDECTHLGNFSVPVDTSLIITVTAKDDAYMPRDTTLDLRDVWPGSEMRLINSGHVVGFLLNQEAFRKAIIDSFEKQIKTYYTSKRRGGTKAC